MITTYNSYIKPEIRNLNFWKEKSSLLLNKGRVIKKSKIIHKNNIGDINLDYSDEQKYDIDDANSLVYTEEEDIINDNFHINGNIIYFEGHFYDDIDFNKTKYLLMKNNLEEKSINKGIIIDSNNINEIIVQKEIINKYNNNQTHFFLNTPKNKTIIKI